MTREEAIKRLKSDIYKYADFTENPNEDEFWTAFDMAIKALEKEQTRWIPVSERLPEKAKDVLVTVCYMNYVHEKEYFIEIGCRYGEIETGIEWILAHDEYSYGKSEYQVIAWMPLPEPYKEVEE